MFAGLPIEFLTMAAAGIGGWAMKLIAINGQRRADQHKQFIDAMVATTAQSIASADAAAIRTNSEFGRWTARLIALSLIGAGIALCFFPGWFEAPAIVQTITEKGRFLFFGGGQKVEFHEVNGFIHANQLWAGFGHVVAFYFGQRAAKP